MKAGVFLFNRDALPLLENSSVCSGGCDNGDSNHADGDSDHADGDSDHADGDGDRADGGGLVCGECLKLTNEKFYWNLWQLSHFKKERWNLRK